jgi:hypothetical protein
MPIVIAACSNRKKVKPVRMLRAASISKGSTREVAASWLARVSKSQQRVRADGLYCGRSFVEAMAAAQALGADFFIVSAGLGLVRNDAQIPAYSATVTGSSKDNILARMNGGPADVLSRWWRALSRQSPVGEALGSVVRQSSGLVLIALPSAYLDMIAPDLAVLHARPLRRLRIFTRALPKSFPEKLRPMVMPYSDRLDGPDSAMPGTRSDFAARALRHFVDHILTKSPAGDLEDHRRAVEAAFARMREQPVPVRLRRSDKELIDLIRLHWKAADGKSGRMLRVLRDDLGIACEQARFARLFGKAMRGRAEP